ELGFGVARSAESWFPSGITLRFFAKQALRSFPVGNGKIVNAFQSQLCGRSEQFFRAIFVGVNRAHRRSVFNVPESPGCFTIEALINLIDTCPCRFGFSEPCDAQSARQQTNRFTNWMDIDLVRRERVVAPEFAANFTRQVRIGSL